MKKSQISKFLMLLILSSSLFYSCKKNNEGPTLEVTDFFPEGAQPGDTITIIGKGFPANSIEDVTVKIGEQDPSVRIPAISLEIISTSSTEIKAVLPKKPFEAVGPIVVATNGLEEKSEKTFFAGRTIKEGAITASVTWPARDAQGRKIKYLLKGTVRVTENNTLTIEKGALIFGDKQTQGTLVIERGASIQAVGTPDEPIVFTSNQPRGRRKPSDWGGIIILGKAPVQGGNVKVEGLQQEIFYGGSDNTDNSGKFQYVRIEFAGVLLSPGNEINGLTLGGVGSNTSIDHVQVSFCGDDSFEWFGGSVNARYLISYAAVDDDFDTDLSYSGAMQFGLAYRDPFITDISQSNGIESDNSSGGDGNTNAKFSNITYVGAENLVRKVGGNLGMPPSTLHGRGAHLRRRTAQSIFNSVFIGTHLAGISLEGTSLQSVIRPGETNELETPLKYLRVQTNGSQLYGNVIIAPLPEELPFRAGGIGVESRVDGVFNFGSTEPVVQQIINKFNIDGNIIDFGQLNELDNVRVSQVLKKYGLEELCDNKNSTSLEKHLLLPADSPLVQGSFFQEGTGADDQRFQNLTKFRGAFGTNIDNWNIRWANFNPQFENY